MLFKQKSAHDKGTEIVDNFVGNHARAGRQTAPGLPFYKTLKF